MSAVLSSRLRSPLSVRISATISATIRALPEQSRVGELRLRARARPEAQIAQDADLELLGQVGLGEGWFRLSPLIAHAQIEHLGPRRRGAVLGTAHATGRAMVGTPEAPPPLNTTPADRSRTSARSSRVEVASSSYASTETARGGAAS
jgi:hypothetical protein